VRCRSSAVPRRVQGLGRRLRRFGDHGNGKTARLRQAVSDGRINVADAWATRWPPQSLGAVLADDGRRRDVRIHLEYCRASISMSASACVVA